MPYLHYYYTAMWFRRRKLTEIGHVAANHSVWDLEPDYLSVEALLLIYADFRVKQVRGPHGEEITHTSSLAEAFDVILGKLDEVDEQKRQRYRRVYTRLQDFERFLVEQGVDVSLQGQDLPPRQEKHAALMTDEEALEALRLVCVEHNNPGALQRSAPGVVTWHIFFANTYPLFALPCGGASCLERTTK